MSDETVRWLIFLAVIVLFSLLGAMWYIPFARQLKDDIYELEQLTKNLDTPVFIRDSDFKRDPEIFAKLEDTLKAQAALRGIRYKIFIDRRDDGLLISWAWLYGDDE